MSKGKPDYRMPKRTEEGHRLLSKHALAQGRSHAGFEKRYRTVHIVSYDTVHYCKIRVCVQYPCIEIGGSRLSTMRN